MRPSVLLVGAGDHAPNGADEVEGPRHHHRVRIGRRLDPANFRRQAENSGTLIPTDHFRTGSHRPARLYRYNQDVELADRGPLTGSSTK